MIYTRLVAANFSGLQRFSVHLGCLPLERYGFQHALSEQLSELGMAQEKFPPLFLISAGAIRRDTVDVFTFSFDFQTWFLTSVRASGHEDTCNVTASRLGQGSFSGSSVVHRCSRSLPCTPPDSAASFAQLLSIRFFHL